MYSIIDIETTGNHSQRHSITEVAVINFDGKEVTEEFCSLVKPDDAIPGFITYLTGITSRMVEDAPEWSEVMERVEELTKGRVLIAHNAHFDYSFLKSAFLLCGKSFQRKTLCTMRMSRQVFPGLRSYGLDKLCRHFEIESTVSHRALADAQAALKLFRHLQLHDQYGFIEASLNGKSGEQTLPPHLNKEIIKSLPEEAGIYYFLNERKEVLYVGKARSIRGRILQHFTANSSTRSRTKLMNSIHHIDFVKCGNELVAMLMESAEIKKHFPPFNVIQKISENNYGIYCYVDGRGYLRFAIKKLHRSDQPMVSCSSVQEARLLISEKIAAFNLCPKLCNIQRSEAACFDSETGKCDGACTGKIPPEVYNERVKEALKALTGDSLTCSIVGTGRSSDESTVVLMEKGRYLGYGFISSTVHANLPEVSFKSLKQMIQPQRDNREVQTIIRSYLLSGKECNMYSMA